MGGGPVSTALSIGTNLLGARKQKKAVERARREQKAAAAAAQARLAPYQEQGEFATQQIREGLDTGTLGGSFVPGDLASDPGYQFQLEQGEQAQDRLQSARGNVYSGQALKERERLSQGLASQAYQDAYDRWLRTQQNRYSQLSGQQNIGYGAAGGTNVIGMGDAQRAAEATLARDAIQRQSNEFALGQVQGLGDRMASAFTGGFGGGGFGGMPGGAPGGGRPVGY